MNKRFYVIWSRDGDFVRMGLEPYDPAADGAGCDVCDIYDDASVEAHSPRWAAYSLPGANQRPDWLADAIADTGYNIWPMFSEGTDGICDYYSGYDDKVSVDDIYKALDNTDLPWDDYPDLDSHWFLTSQQEACWWESFADAEYAVRDILDNEVSPLWDLIDSDTGRGKIDWYDVDTAFKNCYDNMGEVWGMLCRGDHDDAQQQMISAAHTLAEDLRDIARDAGLINE